MKREKWLDCIKIIACFLVVMLHTINFGLKENTRNVGLIFYYVGVFAIPLFFMVNGYLQLRKSSITYSYCFKKILKIIEIVLIWNIFIAIICFVLKGELKNIFIDTCKNLFLQKGYFSHFWFFGSLIILYCFLPLINKIFNSSKTNYLVVTGILISICILVDIFNIRNNFLGNEVIRYSVPQTFRLWTWLTYFCIGGCLSRLEIKNINLSKLIISVVVLIISTVIYEYFLSNKLYSNLYAENFYDNFLVIISSILIFNLFQQFDFERNQIIEIVAPLTMGVYIIHLTVIKGINHFIIMQNNFLNLISLPIVFGISMGISYIIYKIPKINKLIKL